MVDSIKEAFNIKSDRAVCRKLGIHENLISRVRAGLQSVSAPVWDVINKKLRTPEFKEKGYGTVLQITSASRARDEPSKSFDNNHIETDTEPHLTTNPSLLTEYAKDLEIANEIIALLTKQLADKQRTIQLLLAKNPQ